jgi:hypothetical protein
MNLMEHTTLRLFFAAFLLSQSATAQPPNAPFLVPFELAGNTIIVRAVLDGTPGYFVLDTGCPSLIVNSQYFDGLQVPWLKQSVADFHGNMSKAKHLVVKDLSLGGFSLADELALVIDLAHLEKTKGIPLHGIIGFPLFQEMEVLLDFDKQHALFSPLDKKGARLCGPANYHVADSLDLKMSGHFPYILAELEGKKIRLGIDTGAEANVLQKKLVKGKTGIDLSKKLLVRGLTNQGKNCPRAWVRNLCLGHWKKEDHLMLLANMADLNDYLHVGLDGILGTPFLKNRKLAFNYRSRKIYLCKDALGELAKEEELKVLQASKDGQ